MRKSLFCCRVQLDWQASRINFRYKPSKAYISWGASVTCDSFIFLMFVWYLPNIDYFLYCFCRKISSLMRGSLWLNKLPSYTNFSQVKDKCLRLFSHRVSCFFYSSEIVSLQAPITWSFLWVYVKWLKGFILKRFAYGFLFPRFLLLTLHPAYCILECGSSLLNNCYPSSWWFFFVVNLT